jgi:hypothetical protein
MKTSAVVPRSRQARRAVVSTNDKAWQRYGRPHFLCRSEFEQRWSRYHARGFAATCLRHLAGMVTALGHSLALSRDRIRLRLFSRRRRRLVSFPPKVVSTGRTWRVSGSPEMLE